MQIIGGKHKSRKLKSPKSQQTRPTASQLRETLFNLCQWDISEARFLDLFAGVGAIGLEALSRGASQAIFVDKDKQAVRVIQENIALLKEENHSMVFCLDVFRALAFFVDKQESFDLIFADPPYGKQLSQQVLEFIETHSELLRPGGSLFLEDQIEEVDEKELKHLFLKSSRRVGHALLRHYQKKEFES